jgi:hypothetical protein
MTFARIIELHDFLLRNDGHTPGPVRITLGLRPDFSKRFASLLEKAHLGKGLSDVVSSWDQISEDHEDVEEFNQLEESELRHEGYFEDGAEPSEVAGIDETQEEDTHLESEAEPAEAEPAVDDAPSHEIDPEAEHTIEGALGHEDEPEAEPEADPEAQPENELVTNDSLVIETEDDHERHLNEPEQESHTVQAAFTIAVEQIPDPERDADSEDGDLIDYEDDEQDTVPQQSANNAAFSKSENGILPTFIMPCHRPGVCFCSECNVLLLAEYEAKEEELERHSFPRADAESLADPSLETSVEDANASFDESAVDAPRILATDDVQQSSNEEIHPTDAHEDAATEKDDSAALETQNTPENQAALHENSYTTEHQDAVELSFDGTIDNVSSEHGAEDVITQEDQDPGFQDNETVDGVTGSESNTVTGDVVDPDEIDYDEEIEVSELVEPVDSAEHEESVTEPTDEIDYEDDEEDAIEQPQETFDVVSPSSMAKRPRSEIDEEAGEESSGTVDLHAFQTLN